MTTDSVHGRFRRHAQRATRAAAATALLWLTLVPCAHGAEPEPPRHHRVPPCTASSPTPDTAFRYPKIELQGHLKDIFTVCGCNYISGMTCRIEYNGVRPLPSKVFFRELDEAGKPAGPEVRLIYPKLEPGETGFATFRLRTSRPAKISLRGEWKGPWRDPY